MAHYSPKHTRGRSLDELKAHNQDATILLVNSLPDLTVKRTYANDYFPSWTIRSGDEYVGHLTFDNSTGRWTIKGRYFPQARNQRWGEGSMWRNDLPKLLEAAKPYLRGMNPYEAAREASKAAYDRLNTTPEDAAIERWAERNPAGSHMLLNGRQDAALLNIAAAFYTSDNVLTPEEREAFRIRLLKIRRDTETQAALLAMHEMWLDFDTRMHGHTYLIAYPHR